MQHQQFTTAQPVRRKLHEHPTPDHTGHCIEREMMAACKKWEAETGRVFPFGVVIGAIDAGLRRANRENREGEL